MGDFRLERSTGLLSTSRALDRERKAKYVLTVTALDQGVPPCSASTVVEVAILDINDNSPVFQSSSYTIDVSEDVPESSAVLEVTASDDDEGPNGQVRYYLSHEAQGMFLVDEQSGRIFTAGPLDREKRASYSFQVWALDSAPAAPRNSTAQVTVHVLDINDNAPFFVQDPLIINISSASGQGHRTLATMQAGDKDFGANGSVFYRFANPMKGFAINSLTGAIQATENLQGLTQSQRTLIVEAMDQGSPAQSSFGVVVVYVREQPYRGIRFSRNARDVSLQENAAQGVFGFYYKLFRVFTRYVECCLQRVILSMISVCVLYVFFSMK